MEIADLLAREGVIPDLRVATKKDALAALARNAAGPAGLHERVIFEALLERERLGTTGIGRGVAVPHAKLPRLERLVGGFARLATPIDFDAVDDEPVDLVFLLLAPETAGADHLRALARVSRLLRDVRVCEALRGEADPDRLFAILTAPPQSHAA